VPQASITAIAPAIINIGNGDSIRSAKKSRYIFDAKKIFVPFLTTREGGSGVGLARQVMIAHGGFIRVADNKGGGAVFQLTF